MNTDTPRTQAEVLASSADAYEHSYNAMFRLAVRLERELTASQEKVKRLTDALKSIAGQPMSNDWCREYAKSILEATK